MRAPSMCCAVGAALGVTAYGLFINRECASKRTCSFFAKAKTVAGHFRTSVVRCLLKQWIPVQPDEPEASCALTELLLSNAAATAAVELARSCDEYSDSHKHAAPADAGCADLGTLTPSGTTSSAEAPSAGTSALLDDDCGSDEDHLNNGTQRLAVPDFDGNDSKTVEAPSTSTSALLEDDCGSDEDRFNNEATVLGSDDSKGSGTGQAVGLPRAYLKKVGLSRCTVIQSLGKGSNGLVELVDIEPEFADEFYIRAARKTTMRDCLGLCGAVYESEVRHLRAGAGCRYVNQLLGCAEYPDHVEILLEWAEWGSLADELEWGPICEERLKEVVVSVLRGLEHFHSRGLVHQDIKIPNILIGEGGRVMLGDLGCMAEMDGNGFVQCIGGSPLTMSPESFEQFRYPTARSRICDRSDIYSLGRLILDSYVWYGKQCMVTAYLMGGLGVDELPAGVPAGLVSLLELMLRKDPAMRISAADALRHPYLEGVVVA